MIEQLNGIAQMINPYGSFSFAVAAFFGYVATITQSKFQWAMCVLNILCGITILALDLSA